MRIATWNVNSLKARQDAVEAWLARAKPDIAAACRRRSSADQDAPVMAFAMHGYDLVHHGEGRWNGVAIAVRQGLGGRTSSRPISAWMAGARQQRRRVDRRAARTTSTRSTRRAWSARCAVACAS